VPTRSNLWTSSACEGLEKTQQRWEKNIDFFFSFHFMASKDGSLLPDMQ
jgi:hypothetical protein